MTIKYIAKHEGKIVGTRTSAAGRVYTHAIVVNGNGKTDHVVTWCGRPDLALGEQRKYERFGYRAEIADVEVVPAKLPPRTVVAGAGENYAEVTVTDQELLRSLENLSPRTK